MNQQNVVGQVFEQLGEIPKKAASDTLKAAGDIAAKAVEQGVSAVLPTAVQDSQGKAREQGQGGQSDQVKMQKRQEERRRFQQFTGELEQVQRQMAQKRQQEAAVKRNEVQEEKQEEMVKKREKDSFLTRLLNKAKSESTGETMRKTG